MFNELLPYLPVVLVLLLMVRRTQRSRRVYPKMLWIMPAVLLALSAFYIFGAVKTHAQLNMTGALIVLAAVAFGAVLGAVRAHTVTLTRHATTGVIESKLSMWGLLIIVAWMVIRVVLRRAGFNGAAQPFGVFNDATLALVVGSIVARSITMAIRCAALEAHPETPQAHTSNVA